MDIRSFKNQEIDRLNAEQGKEVTKVFFECGAKPELVEGGHRRFQMEAIPEKTRRVVRGSYTTEIYWKIPEGMDLDDEETYQYGDKWGTLYITNKKTGEELEIEGETIESDQKRCDEMEYQELDRKQFQFVFGDDAWSEEEEEKEVFGVCDGCGMEGKFFGKEGDDWTCSACLYGGGDGDDEVSAEIVEDA